MSSKVKLSKEADQKAEAIIAEKINHLWQNVQAQVPGNIENRNPQS